MNATDDVSGRGETLRRLPGLTDADIAFPAQHRLGHHLMREAAAATPARPVGTRRRPMAVLLAAGAATCAVALAATLGVGAFDERPTAAPPEPAAVRLLDRLALTAQDLPAPAVRDDQFLYTKTTGHSTTLSEIEGGGMESLRTDASAERWLSVDGSADTVVRTARGTATEPAVRKGGATINGPTYRFLESLPTDPDELLKLIYADTRLDHGPGSGSTTGPDQEAFVAIGDLLRSMQAPPGVSAALYRAAARIPGVVYVPEAEDAAGRTGVAVARVHDGERTEWIFDRDSRRLLGERTVLLKDSAWGKRGESVTSVALIATAVVDEPGREPGR
ncbi:CU044_5270 family protein [Streptomyces sp. NPDC059564]|uniref:CU044_5270 family protein n=1 Tax=Streptomyces sp. NPDC059564 TaxID=3346865 RepID=UPI0036BF78E8